MRRALVALSVTLLVAVLAGCGWQLRGAGVVPIDDTRVYVDDRAGSPELERAVSEGVARAGAELVEDRDQAEAVIVLLAETVRRRALAIDRTARVQEYELQYSLRFQVLGAEGDVWLAPEQVSARSAYRYDRDNVLAAEAEEADITRDLRRDGVRLLLARAQAAIGRQR